MLLKTAHFQRKSGEPVSKPDKYMGFAINTQPVDT